MARAPSRRLTAVDVDGIRHRMVTGIRAACGTVFIDLVLMGPQPELHTGVEENDLPLTCIGCIALGEDSVGPGDDLAEQLQKSIAAARNRRGK